MALTSGDRVGEGQALRWVERDAALPCLGMLLALGGPDVVSFVVVGRLEAGRVAIACVVRWEVGEVVVSLHAVGRMHELLVHE